MAFFDWNQKYSVGVKDFDDQHQQLIGMLNELYTAMSSGHAAEVMGGILTKLVNYTKTHFANEEKLMTAHAYPGYAAHKKQHDDLTRQASELLAKFSAGKTTISLETGAFLKDWLVKHIMGTDQQYTKFFNEKNIH